MGIKLQLLGISVILAGIAISSNNFFGIAGAILGLVIVVAGVIRKDKN